MALRKHSTAAGEGEAPSLQSMDAKTLLKLRHEVDQALGLTNLAGLDIEQEIIIQLQTAKVLQADVLNDEMIPANQRAQTVNTVSSILAQLVKTQTDLYNAERIKEIEAMVVSCMREQPDDVKEKFFERYERLLATKEQTT